ncbi:hypothetical protein BGZ94_005392, partial [Podila epigama]
LVLATGQSPPAHVQQSSDLCSDQICITGTIYSKNPTTIEFAMHSKIAIGWMGLGMGGDPQSMARNDLAICWPSSTGSETVISQRTASANGRPSVSAGTPVPFKVETVKSGFSLTNGGPKIFSCTYSRPLNLVSSPIDATATSVPVIYAIGLDTVSGPDNPQTANFQRHVYTGKGTLTIVRKEGSSLDGVNTTVPPPTPGGGGNGGNNNNNGASGNEDVLARQAKVEKMVKAHGIMMAIVFLLILPVGASLPRFFGERANIFKWHRPLQATGFVMALVAFILIIVAVEQSPSSASKSHFKSSSHATLGIALILAMALQVAIGIFIFYTFDPTRHDPQHPTVPTWVHRGWGYCVLGAGLAQVHLGMKLYGAWPTGKEAIWYVFGVWAALITLVFVLGSILKRWHNRRSRGVVSHGGDSSSTRRDQRHASATEMEESQGHGQVHNNGDRKHYDRNGGQLVLQE